MERRLEEVEYLDILPPDSPEAKKGRDGLKKLNFIMGNFSWFKRKLGPVVGFFGGTVDVLEIGAGDGSLGSYLYREPLLKGKLRITGLDRIARPGCWPKEWDWIKSDLFEALDGALLDRQDFKGILANMVLHHFSPGQLGVLGKWIKRVNPSFLFFCEPLRSRLSLIELFLLRLAGLNEVTFHDGWLSIKSGFRDQELVSFLKLEERDWYCNISSNWMGAYRLEATAR
ncbi:class I SAM-dependent methyltransferase [Candidatus Methylacidiphilum infernorum]|uniref:Class I SAM-dependent methyltransferase n=1 Tax=Candidatus Methylacidiphilum infernorum TaxID=511746 RepID=A0ABX7PWV1_9BACT|nr:class I SAM-dependent methyltransferase [Candidatus Methylacidiphilum infernorum]QSR87486.1 class I SAM-dependent methyltransferase [Candidatus Methylacidiphilum infernorum]